MSKKPAAPSTLTKALPAKEASHFKQVLKFYESKQYKKGLKLAEQILKNYPEHGETLAMKGLILNCMERKTEAYDFVKRGLRNDIMSHICWHVFGLLYRSDRNYTEAIKCYLNALKHDKKNPQILRDLSLLQVQMRDYKGFVETRRQLLLQKSSNKANWIAYTLAQHLNKDYAQALRAYDAYEDTLEKPWKKNDFELSEMLLYKNQILQESGDLEKALSHLTEVKDYILDKVAIKEKTAELLLKLNRASEAQEAYKDLIQMNPDNLNYHKGYRASLGDADVKEIYKALAEKHPRAALIAHVRLELASNEEFKVLFEEFVRGGFKKGIPSLFNSLKKFYTDSEKVRVIEEVVLGLVESFKSGKDKDDSPLMLLWALFFLAQHYDATSRYEKALETIDEAIAHTPTAIELYSVKGKIYKHAGNLKLAAHYLDQARNLDLADRYLNTRSTLYYLRADQIDVADRIIALFTKDGAVSSQSNLFDMQCMWYEQECGNSHFRRGEYGKALKKYVAIEKHFADITEDQFDFHTYYIRKMTLRAYVQLLRLEEGLYSHKKFFTAAKGIINCYLAIYDKPKNTSSAVEDEYAGLSESERKKALNKKKKAELILKKETKAEAPKEEPKNKKNVKPQPVDEDPNGDALANVEDPLAAAIKYLKIIQKNSANQLDTHLLACEIYIRKKKYLLVLQALKKAIAIAPDHPSVHKHTIRLFHDALNESGLHPKVKQLLTEERDLLLKGQNLEQFNNSFLEKHKDSQNHRIEVGRSILLVDPSKKKEAIEILTATEGAGLTPQIAEAVAKTLQELFPDDSKVFNDYKTKVHGIFKFASFFDPNPVSVEPVESIVV